jgi:hypothetical protein
MKPPRLSLIVPHERGWSRVNNFLPRRRPRTTLNPPPLPPAAALAEALRTVMATRRDQENFQLIVITHDETFASLIGTRQHAEFLWRVTKDEAQHSHVAQEDINE